MTIRPARPSDLEPLLDLWEGLMSAGHAADARYAPAVGARDAMRAFVRSTWFRQDPFPHALVAEDGGLLGFVTGYPQDRVAVVDFAPTVRIGDLFVAPSHRRAGLGSALVAEMSARAKAGGFPRLEVGTLVSDARAVAFWRSQGFTDLTLLLARDPA